MLLCLDTSHGASVALVDNFTLLGEATHDNPREHTEALAPLITEVLQSAGAAMVDLTGVVAGTGPAPFTGLRVGLVTARTIALARGISVYGVSALAGVARGVFDVEATDSVTVVTDARRKEVYWARYERNGKHDVTEITPPTVSRPGDVARELDGDVIRGRGVELYPEFFDGDGAELSAGALGRIAQARIEAARARGEQPDLPTEPQYLRRPDIHQSTGRKRAT